MQRWRPSRRPPKRKRLIFLRSRRIVSARKRWRAAAKLVPDNFKLVTPGKLTVASIPGRLPFAVYASDNKTPVGSEPDIAQLVADSLGLELELVPIAWADWPLGVTSGRFDAAIHNITVTEERKKLISTYRTDLIGFYVPLNSKVQSISKT